MADGVHLRCKLGGKIFSVGFHFAMTLTVFMAGCTSISDRTSVSVWSVEDKTLISVYLPTNDVHFNLHALGWTNTVEYYKLAVPRGGVDARGAQVTLVHGIAEERIALSEGSKVTIMGADRCEINIEVYRPSGEPLPINGTYRASDFFCHR